MTAPTYESEEERPGAEAIWAKAADWLAEKTSGDWTVQKQAELDSWLAESNGHLLAYWRVEAAWERTNRLAALRTPLRSSAIQALPSMRPTVVKVAAALLVVSTLAGIGTYYSVKPAEKIFATETGGREIVTLADGSTIELNTNTRLHLIQSSHTRRATLERGEAYFQIRHNAAKPFVVIAGNHRVTDLGTKFVVRTMPGELKVSLLEGSARVDETGGRGNSASVTLTPGDVAIATAETLAVTKKRETQLADALAWRHGLLVFKNSSLAEVAAELNRYNKIKLVIADSETGKIGVGGTFPSNDPAAFVRVAHELLGLRVANRGNELVISH